MKSGFRYFSGVFGVVVLGCLFAMSGCGGSSDPPGPEPDEPVTESEVHLTPQNAPDGLEFQNSGRVLSGVFSCATCAPDDVRGVFVFTAEGGFMCHGADVSSGRSQSGVYVIDAEGYLRLFVERIDGQLLGFSRGERLTFSAGSDGAFVLGPTGGATRSYQQTAPEPKVGPERPVVE